MRMKENYILMRHAKGIHNQKKMKMKLKDPDYKDTKEFKFMKFSKQLMDPKEIQIPSNYKLSSLINLHDINLVLVSPLRRCLQTAKLIKQQFQQIGKNVKFVVQPFLASRLCSAWALGSFIQQLQKQYEGFVFNNDQNYWPLILLNSHKIQFSREKPSQIKQELLYQLKEGKHQSFKDLNKRIQILKLKISKHKQQTTGNILIISHSCLLKALCAKQYYSNGKSKGEIKFQHLIPVFADKQFNLSQNPKPKL